MDLDFTTKGKVKVTMADYTKECIKIFDKFPPLELGTKSIAAASNLFEVDEDSEKLSPRKAEAFHILVAKILFATKRAKPDTGLSILFLTTRVRDPSNQDRKKLVHIFKYLRGTQDILLILRADGSGILKWYVDASHRVHPNMRGHTGGGLTMGTGFPVSTSTKHKLSTRNSTESKILGVDGYMPGLLWTRLFLEAQDYGVKENIMFQDNERSL